MSFLDDIQKAGGVLTDVKSVVEQGLEIFTQTRDTVFPAKSTSEGVVTTFPTTTTKPVTPTAASATGIFADKKVLIVVGLVAAFFFLRK